MGTARQDYVRFLQWLHEPQRQAPENVRRFANMVLADFHRVHDTSRQRNSRSAHLARLARTELARTPAEAPQVETAGIEGDFPWRRLKGLTLGPFRGFRRQERFDLQKRIVLFYGPNGSGKTSLCEALERAMLGSVEEAELKRVNEARYLANVHERRFVEPELVGADLQGRDVPIAANSDAYQHRHAGRSREEGGLAMLTATACRQGPARRFN